MYLYAAPFNPYDYYKDLKPSELEIIPNLPNAVMPSTKPATEMEKEALAMFDCAKALSELSDESKKRVLKWLRKHINEEE
jgi:hypothetical protein